MPRANWYANHLCRYPALSAEAGGLSGSNMGRSVGTISALVVAERSTKDATGAKNGTHSTQPPVAVVLSAVTT